MNNDLQPNSSKLILGTAQLGSMYGIGNKTGKPTKQQALEIIRFAFARGIKTLDTAPGYGDSESIIGEFLNEQRKIQQNLPAIITKIPSVNLSSSYSSECIDILIEKSIHTSLNQLNIETIDVCLLHHPKDMISYKGQVVSSVLRLKNEGVIKKIGVSVYTPEEVKMAVSLGCFDVIQVPINIMDHRLLHSGLLHDLYKSKIDIYARSIYLQGLLFLDPDDLPPYLQCAKKPLENLRELSSQTGLSVSELSMLFVRDIPEIKKMVIGCETKSQLKRNLQIMTLPKLTDDIIKQIHLLFEDMPEKVVNPTQWK
ncbi:aldo/keto reductase [Bacillus litorisediminis]|uniref:aldo/keto reductase n=1 Tax=Bacillus litorisediminis TaxID=2922713 RepID=UPI001FAB838C|nr:aldo/keto reductase [Bacillus litorisediminis]